MSQLNNTRLGYYPPSNSVMLYEFEVNPSSAEKRGIIAKRDISKEFLHVVRDWVTHGGPSQSRIPHAIGRFRNWLMIRVLGRPDKAPVANTRYYVDATGTRYIISITEIPPKAVKPKVEEVAE